MSRVMVFLTWYLRHGSKECDSSSPPARSSPHEFCRPNAAIDVSRSVGTRGWVGWMRGPCACPRPGEMIQRVSMKPWRNRLSRGQAQGPHPSPHPPLVPTERRGRLRPRRDDPLRLEKFIRGEGGGVGKGKKDTGYLYKAFMVARRPSLCCSSPHLQTCPHPANLPPPGPDTCYITSFDNDCHCSRWNGGV